MSRLICPNCSNAFSPPAGRHPVCPRCHYAMPSVAGSRPASTPAYPAAAGATFAGPGTYVPPPVTLAPMGSMRMGSNGLCVASMVLGIVGLPLAFFFIPSLLALILGIVGLFQAKKTGQGGQGMAITGIVLGALVMAGWIFVWSIIDDLFREF